MSTARNLEIWNIQSHIWWQAFTFVLQHFDKQIYDFPLCLRTILLLFWYRNYRSVFTYYNYNFLSLGYNIYKQRDYKESINGKTSSSFTTNTRFYTKLLFNINSFYDNIIVKNFPVEGSLLYTLREMDINSKMKNLPIGLKIGFEDNKYDEHGITYSTEVYLFPGSNYSAYLNLGIDFKIRYTFCKGIK